jgi:putative SOS response-associated peptidase YedK
MCANFQPISGNQAKLFTSHQLDFDFKEDVYPNYDTPLLFANVDDEQMQWRQARFGMVPKWADSLNITRYTYNARNETVHTKPSFRDAWLGSQFALIPVQTIFEPKYVDGQVQRWGIQRADQAPFTIAAIYQAAKIEGEIIRSMSLLTINADDHPFMSQFHKPDDEKRSIVVIAPEKHMDWLHCHHSQAHKFLQPMSDQFTAKLMLRQTGKLQTQQQNTLF